MVISKMDYPDSDEEFEIMHAAELEAMREMEEEECFSPPPFSSKPKSKRSLDFGETLTPRASKQPDTVSQPTESENLQIPGTSQSGDTTLNSSTASVGCSLLDQPSKRTTEDLFGDISDLDEFTPSISNASKRQKLEEELEIPKDVKQDLLINRIVDMRKRSEQFLRPLSTTSLCSKYKTLEDCMTRKVPQWPFIPVSGFGNQRIYLRLHSEEFFAQEVSEISLGTKGGNFLSVPFSELKLLANAEAEKMMRRKEAEAKKMESKEVTIVEPSKELLVERYKPKSYFELLSDEGTNRSLLQWLLLWDKIVFGRNVIQPKKQEESFQKFGWKGQRYPFKAQSQLNTELDETGRPQAKVALLCGPPGLGKTTLAHIIAVQAGYNVVEMNASDDRSPQIFRRQLEASTQMKAVLGEEKRPNCLILDEIDGAPSAAIDVLVSFATDKEFKKGKGKKKNSEGNTGILRRPIICICNDVYVPALRPLRLIAFTLHFPPTSSARLGERLVEICRSERLEADVSTMIALGDKTNNDIRACLSVLQCIKARSDRISLNQIESTNVGVKDMQQGLFTVWQAIFQIVKPKMKSFIPDNFSKEQNGTPSDAKREVSIHKLRMAEILRIVHGCGDYDRLVQGVYENFPHLYTKSVSFSSLALALNWFAFHDIVSRDIYANQNYVLYPYLHYGFVVWHFIFATFAWPKLIYPHVGYEMNQRSNRQIQLLNYCIEGSAARVRGFITKDCLLLDFLPYLLSIINPNIRTVSSQLLSQKEKDMMSQVVNIMIDYNLNYTQERNQDGIYTYNLDPNLEEVGRFPDWKAERTLSYAGKQMINHEIELEKMRRAESSLYRLNDPSCQESVCSTENAGTPKQIGMKIHMTDAVTPPQDKGKQGRVPSHLQKLTPKVLKKNGEKPTKDFFGRIVEKNTVAHSKVTEDEIVKSDVWFCFKEGHNNAVRKTLHMEDLLKTSNWSSF